MYSSGRAAVAVATPGFSDSGGPSILPQLTCAAKLSAGGTPSATRLLFVLEQHLLEVRRLEVPPVSERLTSDGHAREKHGTPAISSEVELVGVTTNTIIAPGATACIHSTSSVVSPAEPALASVEKFDSVGCR